MKRYLKTPEEIAKELKKGKEVCCDSFSQHFVYKMIDGIVYKYYENSWVMNGCLDSSDKAYIYESKSLKLEVGKFYKTRDGRKAWITDCTDMKGAFPFLVATKKECNLYSVTKEGRRYYETTAGSDLVAPWEE